MPMQWKLTRAVLSLTKWSVLQVSSAVRRLAQHSCDARQLSALSLRDVQDLGLSRNQDDGSLYHRE